ncbi:YoaK family protein [Knoellia aerolata]|uniref:YoaK family protein n=1 Tax=Knoellia aerolata TaxID=442954 RepID=UPI00056B57C7|nr:YoaK family protein [Knoellia aerolata]
MRSRAARVARLAGADRTARRNAWLAAVLALVAGTLNSVGFVAVSVYTSHMTGITASIADQLVRGSLGLVVIGVEALASFVLGAMTCALVFNWGRRRGLRGKFANVLLLEAVLVLAFGGLADQLVWEHRGHVFVVVLCFTMGLQNATITKVSDAQIRTTHVTGMVTDIGIELGKHLYRSRMPGEPPVRADLRKLGMLAGLVTLFLLGGVLGAAGYLTLGFQVLIVPALVLFAVAVPPVLTDLRRR